jgi:hypothetical protein
LSNIRFNLSELRLIESYLLNHLAHLWTEWGRIHEGLAGAKALELRTIEVSASGLGLHWPKLDADLYVPAIVKGILGTKQWMTQIGALGAARPPSQRPLRLGPTASWAVGRASQRLWNRRSSPDASRSSARKTLVVAAFRACLCAFPAIKTLPT